jgi:hypothetical protein
MLRSGAQIAMNKLHARAAAKPDTN